MQPIKLNREQATFIRHLRVNENHSWRSIHKEWQKRYVKRSDWWQNSKLIDKNIPLPHGNQMIGMKLCIFSQQILGNDW